MVDNLAHNLTNWTGVNALLQRARGTGVNALLHLLSFEFPFLKYNNCQINKKNRINQPITD